MAKRRRRLGWLGRIALWTAVTGALAAGILGVVLYQEITTDLPPVDQILHYKPPVTTRIYSDDGTLIGEFYVERRYLVPLERIPQHVRLAFLAAEDADFYRHRGVDPEGMARALLANLFHGHVVQGGSTITQQVVKALLLSPERSYERKLKELVLALRLEAKLSKDDILYLYLSQIYFGAGAYGVAAAAREFFDTNVEDLTIAQAAVLAGLPQAPSRYDPQRHPQHAVARQHYVLQRMRENGFITPAQGLGIRTAWEKGWLPASALGWGARRLAPSAFKPGDVIAVTVTEEAVGGEARFALDQEPQVEGALAAIDPYTGQVKAMVGGYDFRRSQFNRAVQAKRQPGSAFKPLIYACAIDHGYTPASIVLDAPIVLPDGNRPPWMPRNYEDKYYGPTPLRYALARSLNTVTVRLVDQMGLREVLASLPRFGLQGTPPRNLSIALGSMEVTPLDLARAYGVFATLGKRFEPIFITRVTDLEGNPLDFSGTRPRFERVMSPATAYVVTSMLQTVVQHGTGRKAAELGRPVAGKTGTTNDTHDAWFIGFTPDLLAGVWVGFDSERSLGKQETGGHAAAPIWTAFMKRAVADRPVVDFPVPEGVTFAQIDRATGLRAAAGQESELEVFVKGSEPTQDAAAPEEVPANPEVEQDGVPEGAD